MRVLTGIIAAGMVAGLSTAALAEGAYVGAETGLNIAPTEKFKDGDASWKQKQSAGYGLLGEAGYDFGLLRAEAELGWRSNGVDKITGNGLTGGKGDMDVGSLMANVYYDIKTGTRLTPFVGAGVGYAYVMPNKVRVDQGDLANKNESTYAYQGIAGASYALNDNLALKADYRYFRTGEFKLSEAGDYAAAGGSGKAKDIYDAHSVMVGFTYKFGAPAAKPAPMAAAAPMPAPAPMPMPMKQATQAPMAKSYLVFFDFDKSNITPEAERIIEQAAANAKGNKATSIALTGFTDAAGSEKYNMALSIRRGNAVKAALVKLGVPAGEISVVGKGKNDQLVPTKDGVREPQNRRVQIVLP